ncbi:MAG: mechanosensitive ion channel domain-containing protein [Planctomycetota bacterium]
MPTAKLAAVVLTSVRWRTLFCLASLLLATSSSAQTTRPVESIAESTRASSARLEQVQANAAAVEELLSIGLSDDRAGEMLRESRDRLPTRRELAGRTDALERELAEAKLERVRLLEARRLAEPDQRTEFDAQLERKARLIVVLDEAIAVENELEVSVQTLRERLDEELLWVRSARPLGPGWIDAVATGARWFVDPQLWSSVGSAILDGLTLSPILGVLGLLAWFGLLLGRGWFAKREAAMAVLAQRISTDSIALAPTALLFTVLRCLPGPAIVLSLSGLISVGGSEASRAIGAGLREAGLLWLGLAFFKALCRDGGLADVYFEWPETSRRLLAWHLRWFVPVLVATAFVAAASRSAGNVQFQGVGRLAFIGASLAMLVFVGRVLHPRRGVLALQRSGDPGGWRLRRVGYAVLVGIPAGLAIAAAIGYLDTADVFQRRVFTSGAVVFLAVVFYGVMARLLVVARGRVALRQARQRLIERRDARARDSDSTDPPSGEATPDLEPDLLDVDAVSDRTRTLLRITTVAAVFTSIWFVWTDVLPALAILDRVELTNATVDSEGVVIVPAVTVWSVVAAVLAVVLTVVAARNLPAVLELAVLENLRTDSGIRYAAITLLRYVIIAAGVVWTSRLLEIDWSRAQWIVAALGVGLGFGLQEIVANFVSGLIILFERPVRVGDVVTVGEVSGTVSRLKIRATTITDWDNKEIIVPNKSFITDRVINWTLSNSVTRLLIPVGIAYGSDVAKAHQAISEAVRTVPTVLEDPAPSVLFIGFGNSSLDFEVRAFVGQLTHRLPTVNDLHAAIDNALRHAGITIPFPQRDLHIRSSDIPMTHADAVISDHDGR